MTAALLVLMAAAAAAPVVAVERVAPVELVAGMEGEARIEITVAEGFHVQANPASDEFLVPTKIELSGDGEVSSRTPRYPPGKPFRPGGSETDLSTLDGRFEVRVPLVASAAAKLGEHQLQGTLRYQACDARHCLFPTSMPVRVLVRVSSPVAR